MNPTLPDFNPGASHFPAHPQHERHGSAAMPRNANLPKPPMQHGRPQNQRSSGHPPWKKSKHNPPVITKYPLPPGHVSAPPGHLQHARSGSVPQLWANGFQQPAPAPAAVLDGNGDPLPPPDMICNEYALEHEPDEECYFLRHPREIEPHLSLGEIVWFPPLPTKRALPSTFDEVELLAEAGTQSRLREEDSVSAYFVSSQREEAFLSIRQLDRWHEVKNDPIFREFPIKCRDILTMSQVYDRYRSRPDPSLQRPALSRASSVASSREPSTPKEDYHMLDAPTLHKNSADVNGQSSMLHRDNQAHFWDQRLKDQEQQQDRRHGRKRSQQSQSRGHSRATSVASSARSSRLSRPVPLERVKSKDQAQEDVLAALGVTGSPKQVYQTPGPALGAPPPPPNTMAQTPSNMLSLPGLSVAMAQPSFHKKTSSFDRNWGNPAGAIGHQRRGSTHSQGSTQTDSDPGFDFYMSDAPAPIMEVENEDEATPRAPKQRMASYGATPATATRVFSGQKRRFGQAIAGAADDGDESPDEATPRPQRKKQPRVDSGSG